jgi:hypothetical protein
MTHPKSLIATLVATGALIFMTSCAKNATAPDSFDYNDGNSGFVASELNDMASVEAPRGALSKSYVSDTVRSEVIIDGWRYDSTLQGFVRKVVKTFDDTNDTRTRTDTVYFYSNGAKSDMHSLASIDSIRHIRRVVRDRAGRTVNIRFDMGILISKNNGDTTSIKTGTITGTYNGYEFRTTTVTNVERHLVDGHWGFPVSGTIDIDRILRTIQITFTGNGQATAIITRKRDNREWKIDIDVVTGQERG